VTYYDEHIDSIRERFNAGQSGERATAFKRAHEELMAYGTPDAIAVDRHLEAIVASEAGDKQRAARSVGPKHLVFTQISLAF
jgi:hypothetical protein